MNKFFLPIFLIAALVLVSGCTQGGQTSTQSPSPTQTPTVIPTETGKLCPAVCNPLWQLRGNECTFNRCGSGCGADGKTLFETEAECKMKISPTETLPPTPQADNENMVEITSAGFEPKSITVKVGESATFTNKDTSPHWPASAVHPTHKVYPGSDIAKCQNEAEKTNIFDACKGLNEGESWTFTFNEKGTWKYHDHLSSGLTGTIVVE